MEELSRSLLLLIWITPSGSHLIRRLAQAYSFRPFWVDTHPIPPFKRSGQHNLVYDATNSSYDYYPAVPSLLTSLRSNAVTVAAASRTDTPDLARDMARLLTIDPAQRKEGDPERIIDYFDEMEIYPGSKTTHFRSLKKKTGFEYEEMLFFDDESRNRNVERDLGVMTCIVPDGMSVRVFDEGVRRWRKERGRI